MARLPTGRARRRLCGRRPLAGFDHRETDLRTALGSIGLTDVAIVRAQGLALGDEAESAAVAGAKAQVEMLAA